jgi:hypothetical protein
MPVLDCETSRQGQLRNRTYSERDVERGDLVENPKVVFNDKSNRPSFSSNRTCLMRPGRKTMSIGALFYNSLMRIWNRTFL